MDSIQLEYTYLLTNQLESQRRYFEEKIARVEDSAKREIDEMVGQTRNAAEESKVCIFALDFFCLIQNVLALTQNIFNSGNERTIGSYNQRKNKNRTEVKLVKCQSYKIGE